MRKSLLHGADFTHMYKFPLHQPTTLLKSVHILAKETKVPKEKVEPFTLFCYILIKKYIQRDKRL